MTDSEGTVAIPEGGQLSNTAEGANTQDTAPDGSRSDPLSNTSLGNRSMLNRGGMYGGMGGYGGYRGGMFGGMGGMGSMYGGMGGMGGMYGGMGGMNGMNPNGRPGGFRQDYHTVFAGLKNLLQISYSGLGLLAFGKLFGKMVFNLIKTIGRKTASGIKYLFGVFFLNRYSAKVINGAVYRAKMEAQQSGFSSPSSFATAMVKIIFGIGALAMSVFWYLSKDHELDEHEKALDCLINRRMEDEEQARKAELDRLARGMEMTKEWDNTWSGAGMVPKRFLGEDAEEGQEKEAEMEEEYNTAQKEDDEKEKKIEDMEKNGDQDEFGAQEPSNLESLNGSLLAAPKMITNNSNKDEEKPEEPLKEYGPHIPEEILEKRKQRHERHTKMSEEFSSSIFRRELAATENGKTIQRLFTGEFTPTYTVNKFNDDEKKSFLQGLSAKLAAKPKIPVPEKPAPPLPAEEASEQPKKAENVEPEAKTQSQPQQPPVSVSETPAQVESSFKPIIGGGLASLSAAPPKKKPWER